jgi:hypothetical protein
MSEADELQHAVGLAEAQREFFLVERLLLGEKITGCERWLLERHAPDYYAAKPSAAEQPAQTQMSPEQMREFLLEQGWTPPNGT